MKRSPEEKEWLFGRRAVIEALRSELRVHTLWIAEGTQGTAPVFAAAAERGIEAERVSRAQLDRLAQGEAHQGVAAAIAPEPYLVFDELLARARAQPGPEWLLVLDGIQDPQNLGAILRTAVAVGVHGIILPRHRAAGLTPAVARASAGATAHIAVARVSGIPAALLDLREEGIWTVGLDPDGDHDFREIDYSMPLALVVGAEGPGVSRLALERCDLRVRIPMTGRIGSLNASVAAALCLYQIFTNRGLK